MHEEKDNSNATKRTRHPPPTVRFRKAPRTETLPQRTSPQTSYMRRVWRRFGRDERGSVTAELVLAVPALLLLLLVIAQFAVWAHATHIAQAAASQALSAARVQGGSSADGQAQAGAVLAQLGGGPLHDPRAAVTRGPEQSTVAITGRAARVVPFLDLPVRARAVGPSERFVPPEASG